jgi:hypothetical protein
MMKLRFLTTVCAALILLPFSSAGAQTPEVRSDLGANAAMKYWQAFALLPALDADQEKLLSDWNNVPLDAAALKLLEASQGSLEYLHRGASLPRCDWSLDYEDGIRMRLPYLVKARSLSRLAGLHARHEFSQGRWQSGWDDVTALLKLGRQVEIGPTFIQQLVGYLIERAAIEAAAPWLPELKSALPATAFATLESLPAAPTVAQVILDEKRLSAVWMIRELKQAEHRRAGSWREVWKELIEAIVVGNEGQESANRDAVPVPNTYEQALKLLEDLLPLFDELARLAALPWREFDDQYAEFTKKTQATSPLARFVLPNLNQLIPSERRNQTQAALFRAALAVVQDGPGKLKEIPDPFGSGPFEYRPVGNGFELKSKLLFKGQPVTLTAGKGK